MLFRSIDDSISILKYLNLDEIKYGQILLIKEEEERALKPIVLDICAKEDGVEFLKSLRCDFFDSKCKKMLKDDISKIQFEQDELLMKLERKKRYYEIQYRNILTKAQDDEFTKLKNEFEYREKLQAKKQKQQERQQRIDKLKVWRKFNIKTPKINLPTINIPKINIPNIKYINPKGEITGH